MCDQAARPGGHCWVQMSSKVQIFGRVERAQRVTAVRSRRVNWLLLSVISLHASCTHVRTCTVRRQYSIELLSPSPAASALRAAPLRARAHVVAPFWSVLGRPALFAPPFACSEEEPVVADTCAPLQSASSSRCIYISSTVLEAAVSVLFLIVTQNIQAAWPPTVFSSLLLITSSEIRSKDQRVGAWPFQHPSPVFILSSQHAGVHRNERGGSIIVANRNNWRPHIWLT